MPHAVTIRDAFAHYQGGRLAQAMRVCRIILASEPDHFNALNILGAIQLQQEDFAAARKSLAKAVACKPDNVEAHTNLGSSLDAQQHYAEAKRCYRRAIELNPDYAPAFTRLGNALSREGDYSGALPLYRRALGHMPDDPVLHNNCGMALAHAGRYREALEEYQRALETKPDYDAALANSGSALSNLKQFREAAASYARLLAIEPHNREALAKGFLARRHICDWSGFDQTRDSLLADSAAANLSPFNLLSLTDSGSRQLACARDFSARYRSAGSPTVVSARENSEKIRIAYLSADFGEHPLSYLMAGVFEQQDRSRFQITGVSLQASDGSAMSRRLSAAFDSWLDVSKKTDQQVARLVRKRNVDIAVDLTGFTRGGRSGILARRPAPLQLNYLGYPGSMGADFIDYIIADDYLVPTHSAGHYSEAIARLPNGFQAFDDRAAVAPGPVRREDAGLPAGAWVFCGFNASYKITPDLFDSWMRILKQVPGSVLWLLARDDSVRKHLQHEAEARGVATQRLVFARQLSYPRHLARLPLADLFLDTFPFNAGTTASDALRMGLPLLTCSGESFASRMAGSLLNSLQLPELITTDLASYEARAVQLAGGGSQWQQLQQKLQQQRSKAPIFDTAAFCRQYEAALVRIWERHQSGAPPQSF